MSVTNYDLNEIFDALAGVFNGVATGDEIGGVAITMEAHAEVPGQVDVPAVVLDFDDQAWDLNMGQGADEIGVVALLLVQYQEAEGAQRALRAFLSRKQGSGIMHMKAALEADQTLGGLVSYAIMQRVRSIGIITFNGVDYLGAEIIIEVMS